MGSSCKRSQAYFYVFFDGLLDIRTVLQNKRRIPNIQKLQNTKAEGKEAT